MFLRMSPERYSEMPIHELLAAVLVAKIITGELACGEILPTEASLMRRYQVGRQTVRRALAVLWHERLIDHLPGIGLHVRMPDKKTVIKLDRGRHEQATL